MTILKRLKPIILVSFKNVEGRDGIITLTTIETKKQNVLRELLKNPWIEMLDLISKHNETM